mmetsp:Transcript_16479/g.24921  ORF Transcript_16479/g.24921 Transcript_16479/m.24921 type:complete len:540 (+) Transcript_16479:42-1661(+)
MLRNQNKNKNISLKEEQCCDSTTFSPTTTNVVDLKKPKTRQRQLLLLTKRKQAVVVVPILFVILLLTVSWFHHHPTRPLQPPSIYRIHGSRSMYAKVPEAYRHKFFIPENTPFRPVMMRAFRAVGWTPADVAEEAQFVWDKRCKSSRFGQLKPWQRYSYYPNWTVWDHKDTFLEGMQEYAQHHHIDMYMIPETYPLGKVESRQLWQQRLDDGDGMQLPWVLKEPNLNNGQGITMLPPNSIELQQLRNELASSKENDDNRVVQAYICHELTWDFGKRAPPKFDLRFYWMVASIDPLIVLYHDGYVRVGHAPYDESNWGSTTQHLTTHTYRSTEDKGTMMELEQLLQQHVRRKKPDLPYFIRQNPLEHVRNQCRQAIAHTVRAFSRKTFGTSTTGKQPKFTAEGAYGLYGADFILDDDLHVWYIEAQAGPGMEEDFDFRVDLHRDLAQSMIRIVDEIQDKLERQQETRIFPLKHLGGWDVVYAGNRPHQKHYSSSDTQSRSRWYYVYMEYTKYLQAHPKIKSGFQIPNSKATSRRKQQKST